MGALPDTVTTLMFLIPHATDIALLTLLSFLAGFVDGAVGGGGLVLLPGIFSVFPNLPPATIFGTNKFAALAGTSTSAWRYARTVPIRWQAILPATIAAFIFSFIGARTVSLMPAHVLRPLILVLLVLVAVYTFFNKNFGSVHAPRLSGTDERIASIMTGVLLGFYDGFFGPGTGSFLIFFFIRIFGFDFLSASAAAKIVNVATNLSALLFFGFTGHLLLYVALPMACSNMAGSFTGARLALRKGTGFIRALFLLLLAIMITKFTYDTFFAAAR